MMVRFLTLPAMALALVACGESKPAASAEHVQFAKACVAGGTDQAHCECQATKLDELLTAQEIRPEVYKVLILQSEGKDDEAEAAYLALPYEDRLQPVHAGEAMASCDTPS